MVEMFKKDMANQTFHLVPETTSKGNREHLYNSCLKEIYKKQKCF